MSPKFGENEKKGGSLKDFEQDNNSFSQQVSYIEHTPKQVEVPELTKIDTFNPEIRRASDIELDMMNTIN